MNEERLLQVLLAPHISEKTSVAADSANQHTFRVTTDATKSEIKQAVEKLFNVKVKKVQVVNVKGKSKRFGQRLGKRSDWRKAYVALEAGQDIEFAGAN